MSLCSVALGAVGCIALAAAPLRGVSAPLATLPALSDGAVTAVIVRVNGAPLRFDLDTGAKTTVVNVDTAGRLKLRTLGATTVHGAGTGTIAATTLAPLTITVGGVHFPARGALAIDLSHVGNAVPLDGLLGYDFFARYVVAFDRRAHVVRLFEPRDFHAPAGAVVIPLILKPPRAFVRVSVSALDVASQSHVLRVDTGSSDAVDDDIVLRSSARRKPITAGVGIGHTFRASLGTITTLRLGPFVMHGLTAATGGVQLIGSDVWRHFDCVFDFSRSALMLVPIDRVVSGNDRRQTITQQR